MTYSIDFRKRVLKLRAKENMSLASTAKQFGISIKSIFRWSKRLHPKTKRSKPCYKINMQALKQDIENNPDSYKYERARKFGVSKTGIWHALKRLGITYKKNSKSSKSRPISESKV